MSTHTSTAQAHQAGKNLQQRPRLLAIALALATVGVIACVPAWVISCNQSLTIRSGTAVLILLIALAWQIYERNAPNRRPWTSASNTAMWIFALSATLPMYSLICNVGTHGAAMASIICAALFGIFIISRWH